MSSIQKEGKKKTRLRYLGLMLFEIGHASLSEIIINNG